jgi:hypothetical protein
MVSGAGAF